MLFVEITEAQIILLENEQGKSRTQTVEEAPFIPWLGLTNDQFAPAPDGVLFLCCLGGTYLWRRGKKKRG